MENEPEPSELFALDHAQTSGCATALSLMETTRASRPQENDQKSSRESPEFVEEDLPQLRGAHSRELAEVRCLDSCFEFEGAPLRDGKRTFPDPKVGKSSLFNCTGSERQ